MYSMSEHRGANNIVEPLAGIPLMTADSTAVVMAVLAMGIVERVCLAVLWPQCRTAGRASPIR